MDHDFAAIRAKLRRLRREATEAVDVFGSELHGFRTHPRLSEADVGQFEVEHEIFLPREYREYLMRVGNGGAGPAYGLFKLGQMDRNDKHGCWKSGDGFIGTLSSPFPHTEAWNDRTGEPEFDESRADDEDWEDAYHQRLSEWEEVHYWNPALVNGAIPICHLGCALRQWLVVSGPKAGYIWNDDRADGGGLYPAEHGQFKRVTFLAWYLAWLDDAVAKLVPGESRGAGSSDSPKGA